MKFALNGATLHGYAGRRERRILEKSARTTALSSATPLNNVEELRRNGYDPLGYIERDHDLRRVVNQSAAARSPPKSRTATTTSCNLTAISIN